MAMSPTNQSPLLPQAPDPTDDSNLSDRFELHTQGYPRLAFFFSQNSRYLHLRRFSALAVRNLLYRQHELIELEKNILQLEARDSNSSSPRRQRFCGDFALLKGASYDPKIGLEQQQLYTTLKSELKEYEKALIRFNSLGAKGFDTTELKAIQRFLAHPSGARCSLSGNDALTWGSLSNPSDHTSDLIQVVDQPRASALASLLRDKFAPSAPHLPERLSNRDKIRIYRASNRSFEVFSLAVGNLVTSVLVYGAVCLLYFTNGKVAGIVGVVVMASVTTACSVLFRNQQFISMLATICAVLVTLLLRDDSQHGPIEALPPQSSSIELR
ncbi:hypothetical protein IQ07DRAFT_595584 [Pyrenochaeta sp. DS3sAY3a]|nr:hypothetical protein IQ07DRAFT_595584 [Pyrenochaeta sp. DS3sAY3a]